MLKFIIPIFLKDHNSVQRIRYVICIDIKNCFLFSGEIIKPEEWVDATTVTNENPDDGNDPDIQIVDEASDMNEIPTKCVQQTVTLNIKAQVQYIDFEGRSDGESVMKLVQQVKPRRVIIVRGPQASCESLAKIAINVTNETGMGGKYHYFTES